MSPIKVENILGRKTVKNFKHIDTLVQVSSSHSY